MYTLFVNVVFISPPHLSLSLPLLPSQLMYTGSGHVFGLIGKEVPKGEWKMVELPDKNVKVEHCSCDNTGTFSLVVTNKGVVYFGGLNKKGEAAEPGVYIHACIL
jgi:E3 ubiquitin-protein ligase MYCBP2